MQTIEYRRTEKEKSKIKGKKSQKGTSYGHITKQKNRTEKLTKTEKQKRKTERKQDMRTEKQTERETES
jgi:hypothetical protein